MDESDSEELIRVLADLAFFGAPFPPFVLSATSCGLCSSYSSTISNPGNFVESGDGQLVRVWKMVPRRRDETRCEMSKEQYTL